VNNKTHFYQLHQLMIRNTHAVDAEKSMWQLVVNKKTRECR